MNEAPKKEKPNKGPFDVSRKIPLASATVETLEDMVRQLTAVDSILDACVDRHNQLRISYDASSVGVRDIEALLDNSGIARASGAWWRLKSAWYRFLDENAYANAHSRGGACCNHPPSAIGKNGDAGNSNDDQRCGVPGV